MSPLGLGEIIVLSGMKSPGIQTFYLVNNLKKNWNVHKTLSVEEVEHLLKVLVAHKEICTVKALESSKK